MACNATWAWQLRSGKRLPVPASAAPADPRPGRCARGELAVGQLLVLRVHIAPQRFDVALLTSVSYWCHQLARAALAAGRRPCWPLDLRVIGRWPRWRPSSPQVSAEARPARRQRTRSSGSTGRAASWSSCARAASNSRSFRWATARLCLTPRSKLMMSLKRCRHQGASAPGQRRAGGLVHPARPTGLARHWACGWGGSAAPAIQAVSSAGRALAKSPSRARR